MKIETIEIGAVNLTAASFRQRTRMVAYRDGKKVHFGLQYQHAGEPGVWLTDQSLPWNKQNLDTIIRAAAGYHDKIEELTKS